MELLVVKMNTPVKDNTWLEEMLVDRDSLLPVENRDRVLLVNRDNLLLEDYKKHCSA